MPFRQPEADIEADDVDVALARKYDRSIVLCGDTALNKFGTLTTMLTVWNYIGDGPYEDDD